jgi:hypothetical protein
LRWTDRLQQRFGFLAIHGLGRIIVTLQVLFYAGSMAVPDLAGRISLDPSLLATEPWRLATFIFVPPATNPFFAIFFFMFQWTVFQGLEAEWGAFKLTLYCALGWLAVAALPLLLWLGAGLLVPASATDWSLSIWLAFAFLYPDFTILIFFILPVKMKWMAWLTGAFLLFKVSTGGLFEALSIAAGLLNYLLFFAGDFAARFRLHRQVQEGRQVFIAARRDAAQTLVPRACVQCGAGPDAHLRLCCCARCGEDGKFWCAEHLPAHLAAPAGPEGGAAAADGERPPLPPKRRVRPAAGKPDGGPGAKKKRAMRD